MHAPPDFRAVDVARLRWDPSARGAVCTRGDAPDVDDDAAAAVRVQTPPARCHVSACSYGWTLDLHFEDGDPPARAFVAFVEACAASASAAAAWAPEAAEPMGRAGPATRTLRLTAFSDAAFFAADGLTRQHAPAGRAAECVLDLRGVWVSGGRWGLRWHLVQAKMGDEAPPPTFAFI